MSRYRVNPIVPSNTPLGDEFKGVDYHEGWTFPTLTDASVFAEKAKTWPRVVYVEIHDTLTGDLVARPLDRPRIRVQIQYVKVGNDITDALGWDLGALAAICFDRDRQGLHFLVPCDGPDRDSAEWVLRSTIDGADLYDVVDPESAVPSCDYNHYDADEVMVTAPANWWVQCSDGAWVPVCSMDLADFWEGSDVDEFKVRPISKVPDGPKRIKEMSDR